MDRTVLLGHTQSRSTVNCWSFLGKINEVFTKPNAHATMAARGPRHRHHGTRSTLARMVKNSADGQRLEGLLVLGRNPPDSLSNLFASTCALAGIIRPPPELGSVNAPLR